MDNWFSDEAFSHFVSENSMPAKDNEKLDKTFGQVWNDTIYHLKCSVYGYVWVK